MTSELAVRAHALGGPEVLRVERVEREKPGPGQVSVRIQAASINPADLLYVEGRYFARPELPAVPGGEGAGVIDAIGPGVEHLTLGTPVTLKPNGPGVRGTWRSQVVLPVEDVMLTPVRLSPQQAAAAWLVYLTAWVALTELASLGSSEWLLVTAANSAVGLAACDVARNLGARTIAAVRSHPAADAIRDAGFEAIIRTDEARLGDVVRELTGGGVHVALDCVLGEIGGECLRSLRPYGTLVVYGALSGQPLEVRGGLAIARQPTVRGLWLGQWLQDARLERIKATFAAIEQHFAEGSLTPRVDREFPLEHAPEAVRYMTQQGRGGKVVLTY